MKYPNSDKQKDFMGKPCYFDGEYYRDYGKKKISTNKHPMLDSFINDQESIPVKWKIQNHATQAGWIVGFGFVFNGTIEKEIDYKYFRATKRINYVRVRATPTSKELKIPFRNIRFKSG